MTDERDAKKLGSIIGRASPRLVVARTGRLSPLEDARTENLGSHGLRGAV